MTAAIKTRIYGIIESPEPNNRLGLWFDRFMTLLIVTNVTAVMLETMEAVSRVAGPFLTAFEIFSVVVFTFEYTARIWVCTEDRTAGHGSPAATRIRHMLTPMALIDLIAILPFYLSFFLTLDLRFMRVFRLLRLLKLSRYSPALETVGVVFHTQRRPLAAGLLIMLVTLVFASSIVYLLEREAQPEAFTSIPHAMWWGLATLTTVGYGDVTPVTGFGKLFGALIMILGIAMFALPTGILATGFANEFRKREFVVTWRLVASVPLFAKLDALRIAEVAGLLHAKIVPPRYTVVRRGEATDAMYFIVSGEVDVELAQAPIRLGTGDFFGEIALLKESQRTATVIAVTECQLLTLEAADFRRLLAANPELGEALENTMRDRLAHIEDGNAVL
ncbi:MAG: cyclic nucleotide-gated ion channel [Rhodospirillales bacterium]|nr:cyclic nucleotide-gated ion channel [Rhodospirillales bacterium]